MTIDTDLLFEECPYPTKYLDDTEEIHDVAAGKKAIASFVIHESHLTSPDFLTMVRLSLESGLLVSQISSNTDVEADHVVEVYVHKPSEAWRINSLRLLRECSKRHAWTDTLEVMKSRLLGYSESDISLWMERMHQRDAGWNGVTAYAVMSEQYLGKLDRFGMKCFDADLGDQEVWLITTSSGFAPRDDVADRLPPSTSIARVVVRYETLRDIVPELIGATITSKRRLVPHIVPTLNWALISKIYIWCNRRWC